MLIRVVTINVGQSARGEKIRRFSCMKREKITRHSHQCEADAKKYFFGYMIFTITKINTIVRVKSMHC